MVYNSVGAVYNRATNNQEYALTILAELRDLEARRVHLMEDHLKNKGWQRACDSPGSKWYWWIEVNGRRWTCWDLESAFEFQRHLGYAALASYKGPTA